MKFRSTPISVLVLWLALGFIAIIGAVGTTVDLVWWISSPARSISLLQVIGSAALFCAVPVIAIRLIALRHRAGLYLGLLPLLFILGISLRSVSAVFATEMSANNFGYDIFARMASVGFAIGLTLFIIKLGFGKVVAAYFRKEAVS